MEVNITKFIQKYGDRMNRYSDSIARSGLPDIGVRTWDNALKVAVKRLYLTVDRQALIDHFRGYGACTVEELNELNDVHLHAMLIQEIATDYQSRENAREADSLREWEESVGGRLHESSKGEWFYYLGL